jgi:hypothetical protein
MQFIDHRDINVSHSGHGYTVGTVLRTDGLNRKGKLCGEFFGVGTYLRFLGEHMPEPKRSGSSSTEGTAGDFYFFESYEEALDTYIHSPHSVRNFQELDVRLSDGESAGLDVALDVTGDYLDIGRYLEGDPECFGSMTNGNPRGLRVNLVVNMGWWSGVNNETINLRSQRIQRLVDWLETQQVRTSIRFVRSTECSHLEIVVKDHDQILDLNDLAVVGHSDFLRRAGFRFDEHSDTWQEGYGSSRSFNNYLYNHRLVPDMASEFTISIGNQAGGQIKAFDNLETWLTNHLVEMPADPDRRARMVLA